jgi:SAM-dependent methyltransferase
MRDAGIEGFSDSFADFAEAHHAAFDVVCSFQVAEHLARVRQLLEPMLRAVRPGGRMFIAVPNELRSGRQPLEPFDWPPHHLSRWRPDHFRTLAESFGMELLAVDFEPPTYPLVGDIVRRPVEDRVGNRVVPALWRRIVVGPRRYRWAVRHGLFQRRGIYGHTMLAEFRLPEA